VTAARGFVRETLSGQAEEVVDAVELMACELATNCVQHARTDFELVIYDQRGEIRVEVSDAGGGRPTLRSPTSQESSGRGLRIVEALSNAWGVVPGEAGSQVWFTVSSGSDPAAREPVAAEAAEASDRRE
jgi:hypothetical protein